MMKKVIPQQRKIFSSAQIQSPLHQQNNLQANAVKKINSLLQSGTVSVTNSPSAAKILQKTTIPSGVSITQKSTATTLNRQQKCYICGDMTGFNATLLTDAITATSQTEFTAKIAKMVGEGYMVIVGNDDVVCKRCITLLNQMDKLETDLETVRNQLTGFIHKKYNIHDDDSPPPVKMQKLGTSTTYSIKTISAESDGDNLPRKVANSFDSDSPLSHSNGSGNAVILSSTSSTAGSTPARRGPIKIYKCTACDFKTPDLSRFTPHYEQCKGNSTAASTATSTPTLTTTTTTSTPGTTSAYRCKVCKKLYASVALLKSHSQNEHNITVTEITQVKVVDKSQAAAAKAVQENATAAAPAAELQQCNMCSYKTTDQKAYDEHVRRHIKLKPFKCRVCLMRFETREQASIHAKTHQPDIFRCGLCNVTFNKRENLMKHLETHEKKQGSQIITQKTAVKQDSNSTQKLLQQTIDEALRDAIPETIDAKTIQFHSCTICSLTFINEQLYSQHMKMHKPNESGTTNSALSNKKALSSSIVSSTSSTNSPNRFSPKTSINQTKTSSSHTAMNDDLESIFEKIHSDKNESHETASNFVLTTTQEGTSGNITFNINLAPQADDNSEQETKGKSIGIDMPTLDQGDNEDQKSEQINMPVSMPSLDDDGETQNSQQSNTEAVPMDLEDLQNAGQIKYILNENGQLLQLDNHILTTDADGNQILVQGTDSEQIQQLLQSVGVMVQGEGLGEGETLQMISGDGQNQMILVQGADGQEQLIDASLLNADGNIVIQQGSEGELNAEGTHITTEDGIQIPVSVAFSASGEMDQDGNLTVQMTSEEGEDGQQIHLQLQEGDDEQGEQGEQDSQTEIMETDEDGQVILQQDDEKEGDSETNSQEDETNETTVESGATSGGAGGELFNFDELIQPQVVLKQPKAGAKVYKVNDLITFR